ncbi:MAG: hypothetical protein A2359_01150 [Candidatus Moranbacteria bacterium RIFOXYB1_FULL_43_19]|nr:MAG: hypothetical protein A2359_01150 [Candidatus Moranbacteria bacterium RIFOXYB1_FULL_43_19]OGI33019.1 MAG: hypothetical protein A2420_01575 [Candidatus Moranbacteria bacterium RIFOXYC1_FULL_44_13]OGI38432.1 MAG: hypothetical protein A2612_01630 [Candidatus Moranbacteria bacterium RIFOXYD1_FULL_44_12]
MTKEIAIKVENVSKTFRIPHEKISTLRGAFVNAFHSNGYEEFKALDDVSFEVKKGEFFGIIGRNGSGKSTLLKILAGIYQPDTPVKYAKGSRPKGEFHGVKINGRISPFLELGIGFNPELSGRDNIYLNATVLGLTHKQIDEKFDDIVEFSELRRFIDQKVKNYSSGMQVRLAFSVAIHANRDILLMDEVLAVGDVNFQSKCLEEFNKYRDFGKTVVLVTHDIATVQRYCDRAMLLRDGKIEMMGKSEDVGNKYIFQNMSDEEKRHINESAKKNKNIKNHKEKTAIEKNVEITKVDFLDRSGNVKNVFQTGDDISVRVYFKKNKKTENINIGIGLYKDDNSYIFGYNTQMDEYSIPPNAEYIDLSFDSIPLLKGNYFLNCICFGKIEEKYYDFVEKAKKFQVFSVNEKNRYRGAIDVKHYWN